MNGALIPSGLFIQEPWYINMTENMMTVQFNHRVLAISTACICIGFWFWLGRVPLQAQSQKIARHALLFAVIFQVTLGISTLLSFVMLPIAAAHQSGATILLTMSTWLAHELFYVQKKERIVMATTGK